MGRIKELAYMEQGQNVAVRLRDSDPPHLIAYGNVIETDDCGFCGLIEIPYVGKMWTGDGCELDLVETARLQGWVDDPNGGLMPDPNRKIFTVHHARYKDAHPEDPTIPF